MAAPATPKLCLKCNIVKLLRTNTRCGECCNDASRLSKKLHPKTVTNYAKVYNKKYYWSKKEFHQIRYKNWYTNNKDKVFALLAKRRASKLNATPAWLNKEHLKQIEIIYKNRPKGYHVDHIIPLKGINVSGLHVPWNLQYLTANENISKKNKVL